MDFYLDFVFTTSHWEEKGSSWLMIVLVFKYLFFMVEGSPNPNSFGYLVQ